MAEFVVEFGRDGPPAAPDGRLDAAAFHRNHRRAGALNCQRGLDHPWFQANVLGQAPEEELVVILRRLRLERKSFPGDEGPAGAPRVFQRWNLREDRVVPGELAAAFGGWDSDRVEHAAPQVLGHQRSKGGRSGNGSSEQQAEGPAIHPGFRVFVDCCPAPADSFEQVVMAGRLADGFNQRHRWSDATHLFSPVSSI